GDLGAAQFWLDDYRGALEAEQHAVALKPGDPVYEANLAEGLIVVGQTPEYLRQLDRVRALLRRLPTWRRDQTLDDFKDEVELVRSRPKIVPSVARFVDDLDTIGHEIDVSNRLYGSPAPP